ncbi:D-hydantoinase [Colletotrichum fructicola]|nr:D-hydantoinase [Colletotrichum fructicola]KAE9570651.1 D-hydantoinase [Colletotrichum fructicola]KAF4883335.1 Dihydropyrimidinase [Colletotrichum fructicola]
MSSTTEYDLVITNGVCVTASDVAAWDLAIKDEKIVLQAPSGSLSQADSKRIIDARGGYVMPGGIDCHVHLEEPAIYFKGSTGRSADSWETGTRSAAAGGNTTVVAFAPQRKGEDNSLLSAVNATHKLATGNCYTDYGFHVIISDTSPEVLSELKSLKSEEGISSVKIYMTYTALQLRDDQILSILLEARQNEILTMIHAENGDVLNWLTDQLELQGKFAPKYHANSRPPILEAEATNRAIALSSLIANTPILLVHVSDPSASSRIRIAQSTGQPIFAETCPQYLFLTRDDLDKPGFEGAKCVCSPPPRTSADQDAIWTGLANGTFTVLSSDHCPFRFNDPVAGKNSCVTADHPVGQFRYIPNGLPGVETRLPLAFSAQRLALTKFVEMSSTNAAKLYGLYPRKGAMIPGISDADLVIWYPEEELGDFQVTNDLLHHDVDYTPYEGRSVRNWPRYTILRGNVVWDRDGEGIVAPKGVGQFLKRGSSTLGQVWETIIYARDLIHIATGWDDTLGAVASIGSLLQMTCEITKLSYSYLSSVRNANYTRREYLREVNALVVVLLHLKQALGAENAAILSSDDAEAQLRGLVSTCENELRTIQATLGVAALGVSRLLWPVKESDLRAQIDTFQRNRAMFDSFASSSILATTKATLKKVDPLVLSHERSQLLAALPKPTISKRTETCPGTGRWFLESETYAQWLKPEPPSAFLWCHGPPGIGKSGIAWLVVKDLKERQQKDQRLLLCYFFCDFIQQKSHTTLAVLQCMAYQAIAQGDNVVIETAKNVLSGFDAFQDAEVLVRLITEVAESKYNVACVLDAEDEIGSSELLTKHFNRLADTGCRILVTSRRQYKDAMPSASVLVTSVVMESPTQDIRRLAQSRLCESHDSPLRDQVTPELIECVVRRSNGIFLIAHVLLRHLLEQTSVKAMRHILDTAKSGSINDVFESSLQRIDNQPTPHKTLAHRVIGWIINLRRVLTTDEMLHAFATEEDMDEIDQESVTSQSLMLRVCAGLMVVDDMANVRLVHTSVFEFFEPHKSNLWDVQIDIAQSCIRYLCAKPFSEGPAKDVAELRGRLTDMPFLDYSAHHWGYHIIDQDMEKSVFPLLDKLLASEKTRWSSFQALQFYSSIKNPAVATDIFATIPYGQDALHLAAFWGLSLFARSLLSEGCPPSPFDSQLWTPLHWAAANGHVEVAAALAEAGAYLNAKDSEGWTPLFWPAFGGHAPIVKILLKLGVVPSIKSNHDLTALDWAIGRHEFDVVRLLLESDRDAGSDKSQAPKETAIAKSDLETIGKAIGLSYFRGPTHKVYLQDSLPSTRDMSWLERPSEVTVAINDAYGQFQSPVSESTWRVARKTGAIEVSSKQLFMKQPETWKSSLLQSAIISRNLPAARMLVEIGADVNAREQGLCPVYAAVRSQDTTFFDLLLSNGADVDFEHEGTSPLLQAVRSYDYVWGGKMASFAVVEGLLQHGANVNQTHKRGGGLKDYSVFKFEGYTPLMHVSGAKSPELTKLLIAYGADVNARNAKGSTALILAAKDGNVDTIETLLSNGADIHSCNDNGNTVLHAATSGFRPTVELLTLLLDHGASKDLQCLNNSGHTPFRILLDKHAYFGRNHEEDKGSLESHIALFSRFEPPDSRIVKQVCQDGQTLIQAIKRNSESVLQALMAHGAVLPPVNELLRLFYEEIGNRGSKQIILLDKVASISSLANSHVTFLYLIFISTKFFGDHVNEDTDNTLDVTSPEALPLRKQRDRMRSYQEDGFLEILSTLYDLGFNPNSVLGETFVNAVARHDRPFSKIIGYIESLGGQTALEEDEGRMTRGAVFISAIAFASQHVPSAKIVTTLVEQHETKTGIKDRTLRMEVWVRSAVYENMAVYDGIPNDFLVAHKEDDATEKQVESASTEEEEFLLAVKAFPKPGADDFYVAFCHAVERVGLKDRCYEGGRTLLDLAERAGNQQLVDALVEGGFPRSVHHSVT